MSKKVCKAKERVNRNGFRFLSYKVDRKIVVEVSFPNEYSNGFRCCGNGWCYDLHPTIEKPKQSAEDFLNRYYSYCGGVEIIYL